MREGWTYKKLGDYIKEYSVKNKAGKDIPVYSVTNSQGFCKEYFSKEIASQDKTSYKIVPYGFFAFNPSRINVGSIDWQHKEEQVIVSPLYNVFSVSESVLQPYLLYYLKSPATIKYIDAIATGTVRLNLKLSMLKDFSIPVPSLSEQQSIVAELDKINELISLKKAQLSDLDSLAQSIFYDMFGDPIENEKGWEVKMLGEVGEIISGSTPSTSDTENWNGDINWVTPAELGEQLYYGETVRKLTEKGAKGLTLMPVDTVLLSSRAPIGKLAITKVPMCCNQGFKNIICNSSINNIFLYYYLLQTIEHVKSLGRGATFKEVSKSSLFSYKIITPPIYLQQCFATRILSIEQQKIIVNSSIKELETLLASRMQYWFG